MIAIIDTKKGHILYNGKEIDIDPIHALAMAPVGTTLEVVENDGRVVHVRLVLPKD